MGHFLDRTRWNRQDHFAFYRGYEQPFFNVCGEVDCTGLTRFCREEGVSFFLATWWALLTELNAVEAFRCRLRGDEVWVHDVIHLGTTYLNDDETFSFLYMPFIGDLDAFLASAGAILEAHKADRRPAFDAAASRDDLIHGSVVPWVRFTSIAHARRGNTDESVTRVVIGKRTEVGGRQRLPLSIEAHHALVDGLHVGRLFEGFDARAADGNVTEPRGSTPAR